MLDELAERRHAGGLTATSIAWGAWATGMAAEQGLAERLRRDGVRPMAASAAVIAMRRAVESGAPTVIVADLDWDLFAPAFAAIRPSPLLTGVPQFRAALAAGPAQDRPVLRDRLAGMSAGEATRALVDLVRAEVAAVLGHSSAGTVDAERAFKDLGFDSLTAVELRNRLTLVTGVTLPATLVFDHPTVRELAGQLRWLLVPVSENGSGHEETEIRAALSAVPLDRLRDAGLLEPLLRLIGRAEVPVADTTNGEADIDAMPVDDLVRAALGGQGVLTGDDRSSS
jgi:acyl carrier protein